MAFAERLWDIFCAHPSGRDAAARHVAYLKANGFESKARNTSHTVRSANDSSAQHQVSQGAFRSQALGRTGWNAYSFNLDWPTAAHLDSKNVAGSYSALARARAHACCCLSACRLTANAQPCRLCSRRASRSAAASTPCRSTTPR